MEALLAEALLSACRMKAAILTRRRVIFPLCEKGKWLMHSWALQKLWVKFRPVKPQLKNMNMLVMWQTKRKNKKLAARTTGGDEHEFLLLLFHTYIEKHLVADFSRS